MQKNQPEHFASGLALQADRVLGGLMSTRSCMIPKKWKPVFRKDHAQTKS
jgi:hypothetical protein